MSRQPLLTITVPTYNRARHLSFLLRTLERELEGLEDDVEVLVSDNASTDDTPSVIAQFMTRIAGWRARRNEVNEGADANISMCYLLPATPYIWILGDDDAPLTGTLRLLLALLRRESPDMVYLPSLTTTNILHDHGGHRVNRLEAVELNREDFATVLHVQMTFISGLVLRKSAALDDIVRQQLCITRDSNLIQLAWVLENLKRADKFLVCRGHLLMATAANSGGYAVFQVFLINHTRIAKAILTDHPSTLSLLLSRTSLCFLPGLVWHVRNGSIGDFQMQCGYELDLPDDITRTRGFRWLVRPIWSLPALPAKIVFFFSRVTTFSVRQYQRFVLFPRCRSVKVTP